MTENVPLVVLGIGNVLLGDDGVGPVVVQELRGSDSWDGSDSRDGATSGLPPGTELVDGGTTGLALLPTVAACRALLVVDAVEVGDGPGTVHALTGRRIGDAYRPRLTAHQTGVSDLISVARLKGTLPEPVALVGVQPESLAFGAGLSPPVIAALPRVLAMARSWSWRLHRASLTRVAARAGSWPAR